MKDLMKRKQPWTIVLALMVMFAVACNKSTTQPDQPLPDYASSAPHWQDGDTYYGDHQWTEVTAGSMPLIISVPHGGNIRPDSIPDRGCPNSTTVTDLNTIQLARAIEKEFVQTYHVRPYIVVNHLARIKIDQNRPVEDATCGDETMKGAWHDFHNFIDTAVATAATRHGHALFIDLHGHGHANPRLEIGYSLNGAELAKVYNGSDLEALGQQSSLQNLLALRPAQSLKNLTMGATAFGTQMQHEGFPSVPSQQDPFPFADESFFNGGYNTRYYTSEDYPHVFGWQIECNNQGVRDTEANREKFAKAFARVIVDYLDEVM